MAIPTRLWPERWAAAKLRIPVIHVEAGLRSFNQAMPEELNRILTDHASSLLLYPTRSALLNLQREGLADRACEVGDVMYDAALCFGGLAEQYSGVLGRFNLRSGNFRLATVHRAENTDDPLRLAAIFTALQELASPEFPLILPLHPRTRIRLENARNRFAVAENPRIAAVGATLFSGYGQT